MTTSLTIAAPSLLAAVFHSLRDALVICSRDMQIVLVNDAATRLIPRLKQSKHNPFLLTDITHNPPDEIKSWFAHSLASNQDIPCKLILAGENNELSGCPAVLSQLKVGQSVPEFVMVKVQRAARTADFRFRDMQLYLAQHHQQMRASYGLANRDTLTSLYNRRYFENVAERQLSLSKISGGQCLALFDLDHFKRINDTYGHEVGDEVLIGVARTLNDHCRATDIACRWGGEEFVILLAKTQLQDAIVILERLKQTVAEQVFVVQQECFHVTVSVGVVQLGADESMQDCFHRCDQALYEAKTLGRNCLVVG